MLTVLLSACIGLDPIKSGEKILIENDIDQFIYNGAEKTSETVELPYTFSREIGLYYVGDDSGSEGAKVTILYDAKSNTDDLFDRVLSNSEDDVTFDSVLNIYSDTSDQYRSEFLWRSGDNIVQIEQVGGDSKLLDDYLVKYVPDVN